MIGSKFYLIVSGVEPTAPHPIFNSLRRSLFFPYHHNLTPILFTNLLDHMMNHLGIFRSNISLLSWI